MEIIETCPHCECENVISDWNPEQGYEIKCWQCGKKIMLCSACAFAEDNPNRNCDWHQRHDKGRITTHCFRMKRKEHKLN